MKFTDGYWTVKPGMDIKSAVEVMDMQIAPDRITLFCATTALTDRGQTLNSPVLTIEYTAPQSGILKVKAYHHKGAIEKGPHLEIKEERLPVLYSLTDGGMVITSGYLKAEIKFSPFSCAYTFKGRLLTQSLPGSLSYISSPQGVHMREQLALDVGECVYGLGERFTSFVKNGQSVDMWNEDGGTSSDIAYKNVPFYVTNRGYGVIACSSGRVSYEVASEVVSRTQFSVPGEVLAYFILGGEDMKSAVSAYCQLTGKPALPPAWSFGLWLTTSFTTDYDEQSVSGMITGMQERDIPLQVFHFDCFWMKRYEWCSFAWDDSRFPNAGEMLKNIKKKGIRVCCWINPYIAQKSPLFDEAVEKEYLLKRKDGSVWQWDRWQAGMGLVDFTNPEAAQWYAGKLKPLLEMGVDCFKTDFGERIPTQDVVYFSGADPERMHNYYTYLYNKTVFDLLKEVRGEGDACLFARSATAGCQQFPVHWGGDSTSCYVSMAETLRGGLSLSASGFGFWSHDISGFEKTATPDLYKRWVAFGLLSTHSRLHGSSTYRVPWLFDEEAVDVLRYFTKLKCKIMPYIYSEAVKCARTGIPVMRPMVMEFPNDPACDALDRQYMLGSNLLVAPIFREDGRVNYYLPKGKWTHLITNETREGGCWYEERYDYFNLPLYARENSIIPMGINSQSADYEYEQHVEFHVFEPSGESECEYTVFGKDGLSATGAKIRKTHDDMRISMNCKHYNFSFLFRNLYDTSAVKGANTEPTDLGIRVKP